MFHSIYFLGFRELPMSLSKDISIFLLTAMFFTSTSYADSILFLPDSNKSQKQNTSDDFSDGEIDSDLRLFDIQKKDFNPKSEKGFKTLPNKNPTKQDTIDLPRDMQQEDLPKDYSSAFENILQSKELKLAENALNKQIDQNQHNVIEVANGATFIAISKKKNPQEIRMNDKVFPWVLHPKDSRKKIAFVAINYHSKPKQLKLNDEFSIKIVQGAYKKEKIMIADTTKTKPNKTANERITKEFAEANAIYRTYTEKRHWSKPFILPLNSVITSPYGSARVFNGEIKSFHGGTDFRAAIGTPIHASNDGVVVIAKDRFLAGKSVVIDHGEGVFSMYYHCSDIKVKLGEKVQRGQVVALSGDTGRVSGAHLHFGILVNGVQVDPIDFINKVNKLF